MKPFYFATRKLQFVPAAIILIALAISIPTSAQTITSFDAPGAGTGPGQGTSALNINPSGTIIGFSRDSNRARHAFIRYTDGNFTVFGKVSRGLDVARRISQRPVKKDDELPDRPENPVVIRKVTIHTRDVAR